MGHDEDMELQIIKLSENIWWLQLSNKYDWIIKECYPFYFYLSEFNHDMWDFYLQLRKTAVKPLRHIF